MLKAIRAHEPRGRPPQARGSAGLGGRAAGRDDVRRVSFIRECSRALLIELARPVDEEHLRPRSGWFARSRKQPRRTPLRPPTLSRGDRSSKP